jgi:hypothetical protein
MSIHHPARHGDEAAERRAEDDHDGETRHQETVERAAEHASLPFFDPAIQRLAREGRVARLGWDEGAAA